MTHIRYEGSMMSAWEYRHNIVGDYRHDTDDLTVISFPECGQDCPWNDRSLFTADWDGHDQLRAGETELTQEQFDDECVTLRDYNNALPVADPPPPDSEEAEFTPAERKELRRVSTLSPAAGG